MSNEVVMSGSTLALCRLIASDSYAITFQSLSQYRAALISEAHRLSYLHPEAEQEADAGMEHTP